MKAGGGDAESCRVCWRENIPDWSSLPLGDKDWFGERIRSDEESSGLDFRFLAGSGSLGRA